MLGGRHQLENPGDPAARPVATHGHIKDEEKVLVKRPGLSCAQDIGCDFVELYIIEVPANTVLFPFNGKNVEFVREPGIARQRFGSGFPLVGSEVGAIMRRTVYLQGIANRLLY